MLQMPVSAQCNRVNVIDGHMAAMRVKLSQTASLDQVREALRSFTSLPGVEAAFSAGQADHRA